MFCLANFANGNVEPLFENSTGLPDGNVYGIVLNVTGVVINDLSQGRKVESSGNINIHLENIVIDGAISTPIETIGCKKEDSMRHKKTDNRIKIC